MIIVEMFKKLFLIIIIMVAWVGGSLAVSRVRLDGRHVRVRFTSCRRCTNVEEVGRSGK